MRPARRPYKNNTKAGSAQIIFTGMGRFNGSKTVSFKIDKAAIADTDVIEKTEYVNKTALPLYRSSAVVFSDKTGRSGSL